MVHQLYILHSGETPERRLAERLAYDLEELGRPELMTAATLVHRYRAEKGRPRLLAEATRVLPGIMIVLLSRAMIAEKETRDALVAAATGGSAVVTLRRYFIRCDVTPEELRDRYADLAPIYENFTLHAEDQLAAIVEDIRHAPRPRSTRNDGFVIAGGTLAGFLGSCLLRLYPLRYLLAAGLGLVLFMHWSEAWTVALASGCSFMVGLGLSRTDPLDLWPWLGRCWKLETDACDAAHVRGACRSLLAVRHFNAVFGLGSLLVIAFPAAVAAARYASHMHLYAAALTIGAVVPPFTGAVWLAATRATMRFRGLTTEHLAITGETFRGATRGAVPYPLGIDESLLSSFSNEERAQLEQFVFLQRLAYGGSLLRRWTAARNFAFISYAWNDPVAGDMAQRVDEALRAIGVESFRDKRAIRDPYAAWRESVAVALMRCTHFFLILSPGIRHARVVQREIETAIQRRYLELMPAVICVGDPDVERSLREDAAVPLQIRFLLTSCPQATIAEATDPAQLRYLVELTRRQGRWRDWLGILSESAARHLISRSMRRIVATQADTPSSWNLV